MSPTKKKTEDKKDPGIHRDASPKDNLSQRGLDNKRGLRGLEGPRR